MAHLESIAAVGYSLAAGGMVVAGVTENIPLVSGIDIGQVTSVGFAVWFGWYTTSRSMPRMADTFASVVKELSDSNRLDVQANRTAIEELSKQVSALAGIISTMGRKS